MGRRILLAATLLMLTACGFQLRGSYALPFDTLRIGLPETAELHALLKRTIESSTRTRIVTEPKEVAEATLAIISDVPAKTILSVSSAGRPREYQLTRTLAFRVHDRDGRDLVPPGRIVIRRDISFSDAQVLSKESEEALIQREMQDDLVQQLMRRLTTARPRPAKAG